ncbi:MAG: VOC family protein [Bdellovibrionales bacterium]
MFSQFSYPIICSQNFRETLAFYEDHFAFSPQLEMESFAVLQRSDHKDVFLGIMDSNNKALPDAYRKPVQGVLLNYPVENVLKFYDYAYHEGLKLLSEPSDAACGRKHFFVEDPNGILIDIAEDIDVKTIMDEETYSDLFFVDQA